ncbi:hypothetical protein [uncultured Microscilla sp.]|uniref:hypothetical protein n=1 Tax=uncultured Microscilla sp. TaxID=432653 RepID=UPI00263774DA|nr:hypothetical protein [uncultured Microscilla sp.]
MIKQVYKMLSLAVLLSLSVTTWATPTKVVVRAKAKDAKFIGSSVGGAMVIIRDAATNEILTKGITKGSTGNTNLIMRKAHERYQSIVDDRTAKFEATIDIKAPTFITIQVMAPYNKKQATVTAQTQVWLIPGKDIAGEGIIVEVPGFIIDILAPQTHAFTSLGKTKNQINIIANVVMMCGCTISKGGLWDGDKMEAKALIKRNGESYKTVELKLGKQVNTFEGVLKTTDTGLYEIIVYVYDARTGNTGVDKVNVVIGK